MRVLKVVVEGMVTSFRYPHFLVGIHPTYEMPPPATIYGHVCSAVGEVIPTDATQFAYHFQYQTKFKDYEHLHFIADEGLKMSPQTRELLFKPRLTLYLSNADLLPYFQSPFYPVVLGRAQDLMTYTHVSIIELQPADRAFYTGTLLTLMQSAQIGGHSFAMQMPRYIDENRHTYWGQYAVLPDEKGVSPVIYPNNGSLDFGNLDIWIDPETDARHPYKKDLQRGVIWHDWTD
ncbi:MAG: CRISPR-associated protein Cas5 [bacterium]|nr:CRISPR-associated protein Cas5 [bacterium]